MKRLVATISAALLLLAVPVGAITDMGRGAISRLWADSDKFVCTVSYVKPYINPRASWVITAGHCVGAGGGRLIARNAENTVWAVVNWRGVLMDHGTYAKKVVDVAVGTVPDVRDGPHETLWVADKTPENGVVYIHGFPAGIEAVVAGDLVPESRHSSLAIQEGALDVALPGARFVAIEGNVLKGGSSGSPVLDGGGRLVGILWGVIPPGRTSGLAEGWSLAIISPIERFHALMSLLDPK